MPKFAPRIRVEVYIPVRYDEEAYQQTLRWVTRELTELQGGCTVIEDANGYYHSNADEIIQDRVNVVYSDFPLNWEDAEDKRKALEYCYQLKNFWALNLWEESVLITASQATHLTDLQPF